MSVKNKVKRLDNFLDGLVKLSLARVLGLQASHKSIYVINH
jgi:hypothetical protein